METTRQDTFLQAKKSLLAGLMLGDGDANKGDAQR